MPFRPLLAFTSFCGLLALDVASKSATQSSSVRRATREKALQIPAGRNAEGFEVRRQSHHHDGSHYPLSAIENRKIASGSRVSRFWGSGDRTSGEEHVAILITGQAYRFTYKDMFANVDGGLSSFVCGSGKTTCSTKADVYIILTATHDLSVAQKPPYDITTDEIKKFFMQQGADSVYASVLPENEFDQNMSKLEAQMVARGATHANVSKGAWWHNVQQIKLFDKRFRPVSRKLFLRHAAYDAALGGEKAFGYTYSNFLHIREDNLFYHPTYSLERLMAKGRPIFVDSPCWQGGFRDGTYFTSREGADVVFTPTLADFVSRMTPWVQTAVDGKICSR